ncbi:hypothetical protein KP509_02G034800 [Ceratopteris richardii]|nr:hypothetical protein KP509_02G034800 [Ceratopteris richardii]
MELNCVEPDRVTFLCMLKVCKGLLDPLQGKILHIRICEHGLATDHIIGNALVDMFAKVGLMEDAHKVFDNLIIHDRISWSALIAGYAHHGYPHIALDLYTNMYRSGIEHDRAILLSVAKAISCTQCLILGRLLHMMSVEDGLDFDVMLGSALIDMYAKCNGMDDAKSIFDKLQKRNVVSWGALIAGYSSQGYDSIVCDLYEQMQQQGIQADRVIFLCVLKACGALGALQHGYIIDDLLRRRSIDIDKILGSALIELYVLCGRLDDAGRILMNIDMPNNIVWGTLMSGYAINGNREMIEKCIAAMQQEGLDLNNMVVTQVLASTSHSGSFEVGYHYFNSLITNQASISSIEHYTCMIDLLARAGCLDAAANLQNTMPLPPDDIIQRSLLTGCKIHSINTATFSI